MLTLDTLTVESFDIDSLNLHWTWRSTIEDTRDYYLDIFRSTAPLTPPTQYERILSGISAADYSATDYSVSGLYNQHRDFYYSLYVYPSGITASGIYTDYSYFHMERDLQCKFIIRSKIRGCSLHGEPVAILKKRTSGTRCTVCWDPVLGRTTEEHCEICYGSGFLGGFYDQINTWAVFTAQIKQSEITPYGLWQVGDNLVNYAGYPRLAPADLVIDKLNRRWRVKVTLPWEKGMFLVSQKARVERVDSGDVIYQIPITSIPDRDWKTLRLRM